MISSDSGFLKDAVSLLFRKMNLRQHELCFGQICRCLQGIGPKRDWCSTQQELVCSHKFWYFPHFLWWSKLFCFWAVFQLSWVQHRSSQFLVDLELEQTLLLRRFGMQQAENHQTGESPLLARVQFPRSGHFLFGHSWFRSSFELS